MYLQNSTAFSAVKKIDKRTVDRLSKFNIELAACRNRRFGAFAQGVFVVNYMDAAGYRLKNAESERADLKKWARISL